MGGDIGSKMPEIPWTDDDMEKAAEATRRERKRADIAEQEKAELAEAVQILLDTDNKSAWRLLLGESEYKRITALAKHEQENQDDER